MNTEHSYLAGLNEPQRQAVLHTTGPLLVLAGAGSGKTRVITHRIVHLIQTGVAPSAIVAVTFTNKAAREMKARVTSLLQDSYEQSLLTEHGLPLVTTFHALGVRLLREFHSVLGLRRHFTIYDRADSVRAIKSALESAGYNPKDFEPRKILGMISRAKGDATSQLEYKDRASSFGEEVAAEVWDRYDGILKNEHALDFDDLLWRTLRLLREHPPVRRELQERYTHLHVDEYQDTNRVQFSIITELASDTQNVCVVGDIDQNIYSWRGADIKNVLQFERHFPGATTIVLEENYRSTKTIIAASNQVIKQNRQRIDKTVFTNNATGERISLFAAMTGQDEAEYIATKAKSLIAEGVAPSDIAVLYRTNFQSRVLEEAFLQAAIPYQLLGTKFFERKEVKDVLSYLRLALNPDSTADLARVINEPARGIGKVTLLKVVSGQRHELSGSAAAKVAAFETIMADITTHATTKPLPETLKYILVRSGIENALTSEGTEESLERLENVRELVSLAGRYSALTPTEAVEQFLEQAALQSDQDELADTSEHDAVRLMTVHAAKGLEFPYVCITGLEQGLFPHERLDDARIDHEEERRLFYVALTRAEKKVFLTYAHLRTVYGSQRVNVPSAFLNEINDELIEIEDSDPHRGPSGYETTIYLD
jgi:DNA helicase-2/ATP-dependent DNA helicase PcrA